MTMDINLAEPLAELEAAFARYEAALMANDIATLDALFAPAATTVRYGIGENLYGIEEIRRFRSGRSPVGLARRLSRTVITTYGRDFGTASTLFHRESSPGEVGRGKVGRQMQSWVRSDGEWRIVAAHVSLIEAG